MSSKPEQEQTAPPKDDSGTEPTTSERFTDMVKTQFEAEVGADLQWDSKERILAQHLYIKADQQLTSLEAKRLDRSNAETGVPIIWNNVNLPKMALDSVHRIALGLDALIPNHLHIIPYFNRRLGKYDLDLRIGYSGQDYIRRELALDKPLDIRYDLVHENDKFEPQPRDSSREVEGYIFQITQPWDRGKVVGGFGYIIYNDEKKNRLVLVTDEDFIEARTAAQTGEIWNTNERQMKLKTVVHRTTARVPLDAGKINARSYAFVEDQEAAEVIPMIDGTVDSDENVTPLAVDLDDESPEMSDAEKASIEAAEKRAEEEQAGNKSPDF